MGYKAFIVLVWLTVPLFAAAMLNEDMQRYAAESKRQAKACRERADSISRATALLSRQVRDLAGINDGYQLRTWRREWTSVRHQVERELPQLASSRLNHYSSTATLLRNQEDRLDGLVKAGDEAARDWDYYLRGQGLLMEIADGIDQTRYQANYYRMFPNGRGIYLLLQEQLAALETRYQAQSREQDRLYSSVRSRLSEADKIAREVQQALERVSDRMAEDAKVTYAESIRRRYKRFSVQEALAALIDQAVASQPNAPHSVKYGPSFRRLGTRSYIPSEANSGVALTSPRRPGSRSSACCRQRFASAISRFIV